MGNFWIAHFDSSSSSPSSTRPSSPGIAQNTSNERTHGLLSQNPFLLLRTWIAQNTSNEGTHSGTGSAFSSRLDEVSPNRQILPITPTLKVFSFAELKKVTMNFGPHTVLGEGSVGKVFKGWIDEKTFAPTKAGSGMSIAVKKMKICPESRKECQSEVNHILGRLSHRNIVRLLGYCWKDKAPLLVYEFMPRGSLENHLFSNKPRKLESSPFISWVARLKVALDAARGVEYLHAYSVPQIIHGDIKSSNILLDHTWTAKVSGFGLSLIGPDQVDDSDYISLHAAGTLGYLDPEYYGLQQLTTKIDVYSFGVVMLELLTGYKAIHRVKPNSAPRNVVDFAVPFIASDEIHHILDRRLPPPTPKEIEAVAFVAYLAADCVNFQGRYRPSMTEVVNCLERALAACLVEPSMSRSTSGSST